MKITLVKGWKTWWKQWSTWLVTISLALLGWTPEISEALNYAWHYIPVDLKATFSTETLKWAGYIIGAISIPAKLVRQKRLHEQAEEDK